MNHDLCGAEEAGGWLAALDGGAAWREALEAQLLRLELQRAERLMQVLKEGRGAWLPLALAAAPAAGRGTAWLIGNALSGTAVVLARLGFEVTVFDPSATRGALSRHRDRWLADGRLASEVWTRTTFATRRAAPNLCVLEGPVPDALAVNDVELLAQLHALGAACLWSTSDNRFSYKRSTGVRADLRVQSPLRFALAALKGRGRSLVGQRRALAAFRPLRSLALYPHRWDFSLVVGLTRARTGPELFIGPGERTNRLKLIGHRLGLFPWLTPSFAIGGPAPSVDLAQHWLAEVARACGAEPGAIEHLVATRGNNVLLLTKGGTSGERLAVHVPLGPDQERQVRRHHECLSVARKLGLPAPRPIWIGYIDGVCVQCEERVGSLNGAQIVDEHVRERVLLPECSALLAAAQVGEHRRPTDLEIEELVLARARAVAERAGHVETARAVLELGARCAEALASLSFPRVLGHGDLRAKHVAVELAGRPVALLDFGCARSSDLPLVDLLNLVLHDRKDDAQSSLGDAWREARARSLPPALEAVLADYVQRLGLNAEYDAAIRAAYPLFVAASAEQHWDYSRPRWVHRQLNP